MFRQILEHVLFIIFLLDKFMVSVFSLRVLIDFPVLHDHGDFVLVHQEQQVIGRVAIDQENVGISAFLDDAQVALRKIVTFQRSVRVLTTTVLASSAARINLTHSSFVLKVIDGMYAATSGRGAFAMDSLSASLAAAGTGSVLSCRTQDLSSASTWLTVTAQIKKTRMPMTARAALCVFFI
jgi:hypothetical protein